MSPRCLAAHARPAWNVASSRDCGFDECHIDTVARPRRADRCPRGRGSRLDRRRGARRDPRRRADGSRLYLLEGTPGTGKTTFALRFLLAGSRAASAASTSRCPRRPKSCARSSLRTAGRSTASTSSSSSTRARRDPDAEQSILYPSEVELGETIRTSPRRSSASRRPGRLRQPLGDAPARAGPAGYRRQFLALKHFFANRSCTVLLLDDKTSDPGDLQLHSISHGVISLEQAIQEFGTESRRLRVVKMRGQKFQGGVHDFILDTGRVAVFPRLVASDHRAPVVHEQVTTGSSELDQMLGGGLSPAPARCCSARRASARRRPRCAACMPRSSEASVRPTTCSTKACRRC